MHYLPNNIDAIFILFFTHPQDALKGEISNLEKDLSNAEKQLIDTRLSLTQQMKSLENEYKQKIENLKAQNEDNCRRLEQEKVLKHFYTCNENFSSRFVNVFLTV